MTTPLEADPFYRELRRRHPDVDIVLLPGDLPGPADPDSDVAALPPDPAAAAQDTADSFTTLWPVLTGLDLPIIWSQPRWRSGTSDDVVLVEVTGRAEDVPDGTGLLLNAASALTTRSWDVKAPRGGVPRLLASHHGRSLTLSLWDEAVSLTLRSEPYRADLPRRRALLRGQGA